MGNKLEAVDGRLLRRVFVCFAHSLQVFVPADFAFEAIGITNETVLTTDADLLSAVSNLCNILSYLLWIYSFACVSAVM